MNILNILGFMVALLYGGSEVESPKTTNHIHVDDGNRICSNDIKVIDGDTIELSGKRFRLACIDTPESYYHGAAQYCLDNETDCGKLAKKALDNIVSSKLNETSYICCSWLKKDRYDRYLGWCDAGVEKEIPFSESINYDLITGGYAWFYDGGKECDGFRDGFTKAQREEQGLFNKDLGGFKEPRLWRKTKTNEILN